MPDSRTAPRPLAAEAVMDRNRPLLSESTCYAYQSINGEDLGAYIFKGEGPVPEGGRPAIVFFFSTKWDSGLVSQFAPHCLYFANRGMTAILCDFRVPSRFHGATPEDAVADARTIIRWMRKYAADLEINPQSVVAGGGSGGAHAALAAAMLREPEDTANPPAFSGVPDALVLFSPILDVSSRRNPLLERFADRKQAKKLDLLRHVRRKLPPVLILHGTADRVVPVENSERFRRKMWWRGNRVKVVAYEGLGHGFFNLNVDPRMYELTISEADHFLVGLKILPPPPEGESSARLS